MSTDLERVVAEAIDRAGIEKGWADFRSSDAARAAIAAMREQGWKGPEVAA